MNAQQLKKNIGQTFRLRPIAWRIGEDGVRLPDIDASWSLRAVMVDPARVELSLATGHVLELESDNIAERRSPDFLLLRCQIILRPRAVEIEPLRRGSPIQPPGYWRSADRRAYEEMREEASRHLAGGYHFPVRVRGREDDVNGFCRDVHRTFGVFPATTETIHQVTELAFTYTGPASPRALETLCIKHRLAIIECGRE